MEGGEGGGGWSVVVSGWNVVGELNVSEWHCISQS